MFGPKVSGGDKSTLVPLHSVVYGFSTSRFKPVAKNFVKLYIILYDSLRFPKGVSKSKTCERNHHNDISTILR